MTTIGRILLVEDDPKDVELTMTALEEYNLSNEVVVASDGEEALDYLYYRGKFQRRSGDNPAVLLLDLKLPKVDGLQVLETIKSDEKLKMIPANSLPRRRPQRCRACSGKPRSRRCCLRADACGYSARIPRLSSAGWI